MSLLLWFNSTVNEASGGSMVWARILAVSWLFLSCGSKFRGIYELVISLLRYAVSKELF